MRAPPTTTPSSAAFLDRCEQQFDESRASAHRDVRRPRQARALRGIPRSPKNRKKFGGLYHFNDFIPDHIVELSGQNDTTLGFIAELRKRGASGECYLVSVDRTLTGRRVPLPTRFVTPRRHARLLRPGQACLLRGRGAKESLHPPPEHPRKKNQQMTAPMLRELE